MKMEFLDVTGGGEYPSASPRSLIRLSNFSDEEKDELISSINDLVLERRQILKLQQLPFIKSNNCFVDLELSESDEGMVKTGTGNEYTCILSPTSFQAMIDILKAVGDGYNWLTPGEYLDEPAFLISRFGSW